jgi:drug/metabolite transporter (DMT)-like permease
MASQSGSWRKWLRDGDEVVAELWFLLALGTMLAYGIGQVFQKVGTTGSGPATMVLLTALVYGPIWGAWFLLFRDDVSLTAYSIVVPLVGGALGIAGTIVFLEALARGNVSLIGTLVAAYPCVTVVAAFLLLDERLTEVQYAGVGLIILGIVGLSTGRFDSAYSASRLGLMLAVASFLAFGLMGVPMKEAVGLIGNDNVMGVYSLVYVVGGFSYWAARRRGHPEQSLTRMPRKAVGVGAIGLVFGAVGGILLIWAFVDGPTSIVVALSGAYPAVMILLAVVLLKEQIILRQVPAFLAVLVGLPLVSI